MCTNNKGEIMHNEVMIRTLNEYRKLLKRVESSYPISSEEMNVLKTREVILKDTILKELQLSEDNKLEGYADVLRDRQSTKHHIIKVMEECGELLQACAKYLYDTQDEYSLTPSKENLLKSEVDKERLDVLNTLTTFKGFHTMTDVEEKEYRELQMKKHL